MSVQASQMKNMIRVNIQPAMNGYPDVAASRAQVDAMVNMQAPMPQDVQVESIQLAGISAERLSMPASRQNAAILYLHGGGWYSGNATALRPVTWRLAKHSGIAVYAINYRLAPEHPYPAGLDDCVQAYMALLEQDIPATSIVVAGDSSGGDLTFALALRLKAANKPLPAVLVGISPNTDLTLSGTSFTTNVDSDVMLTQDYLRALVDMYAPQTDRTNPFLSPLYGDVAGLPPTYFLVSADELLLDDSTRLAEKMQKAGISVTLDIWPELWHDWTTMSDQVPEGVQAIEKIAVFIATHITK
jgi:acetyl esterase/lipase